LNEAAIERIIGIIPLGLDNLILIIPGVNSRCQTKLPEVVETLDPFRLFLGG